MNEREQRRYVRHPIRVPLVVRPKDGSPAFLSRVGDLSEGGVSFGSPRPLPTGARLEVVLPVHHTRFALTGTVVSSVPLPELFRIGLSFQEPAMAFKLKLAEQALRIEELRAELSRARGAEVTRAEAAELWVARYAETFAAVFTASPPRETP